MCIPCCFTISTSEMGVVESWGKFNRTAPAGFGIVLCPMEQLVGRLSFRVQQIDVRVETKTLDNVFLTAVVSVQVSQVSSSVCVCVCVCVCVVNQAYGDNDGDGDGDGDDGISISME